MHVFYLPEDAEYLESTPAEVIEQMNHDMVDDMIGMMDAVDRAIYLADMHDEAVRLGLH